MGWETQVLTPCPAYPRKPGPRMQSAMTEYSLGQNKLYSLHPPPPPPYAFEYRPPLSHVK